MPLRHGGALVGRNVARRRSWIQPTTTRRLAWRIPIGGLLLEIQVPPEERSPLWLVAAAWACILAAFAVVVMLA